MANAHSPNETFSITALGPRRPIAALAISHCAALTLHSARSHGYELRSRVARGLLRIPPSLAIPRGLSGLKSLSHGG